MNEQDKKAYRKWFETSYLDVECDWVAEAGWEGGVAYERENNSPNEAYIKMLQDTVESQKKQVTSDLIQKKAVVEYCYDHLDKMWAAKITGILLGCDFRDAKEHADEFFKYCEEEGV